MRERACVVYEHGAVACLDGYGRLQPVVGVDDVVAIEPRRVLTLVHADRRISDLDETTPRPDTRPSELIGELVRPVPDDVRSTEAFASLPPSLAAQAVASTSTIVCGLGPHGEVACTADYGFAFHVGETVMVPAAIEVSVGGTHACALAESGDVHCWGDNAFGQLGGGTQIGRLRPAPVAGLQAERIAAGHEATCALTRDGALVCWGAVTSSGYHLEPLRVDPCSAAPPPSVKEPGTAVEEVVASSASASACAKILQAGDRTITRAGGCAGACMPPDKARTICNAWDRTGQLPPIARADADRCAASLSRSKGWIRSVTRALMRDAPIAVSPSCDRTRVLDRCIDSLRSDNPVVHCGVAFGLASLIEEP